MTTTKGTGHDPVPVPAAPDERLVTLEDLDAMGVGADRSCYLKHKSRPDGRHYRAGYFPSAEDADRLRAAGWIFDGEEEAEDECA